jgi:hypothetical protein
LPGFSARLAQFLQFPADPGKLVLEIFKVGGQLRRLTYCARVRDYLSRSRRPTRALLLAPEDGGPGRELIGDRRVVIRLVVQPEERLPIVEVGAKSALPHP